MKSWLAIVALLLVPSLCRAGQGHDLFRVRAVTNVSGQGLRLGESTNTRIVVLVFLGPECPVSQRYAPELNRIARAQTNGVEFFGVISAPSITRTQALAFVNEYALKFPVLFDDRGELARWLRPTHVPEAFVLKRDGDLVYHGRIDDAFAAPGMPRTAFQNHELRDAMAAVLSGGAPRKSYAKPVGCYFEDWPERK
jgi:hypothetical protein